ncbi:lysylphosphatidylglycerol synthase transmembrane domain-containing protein [Methanoregula sp.]|uniref:lysylphosphatidylglycerol synthase transmembrane domain-containing protein n=1 Tax=Methanoregula sp. TaxID=2052170 RepID=UPI00261EA463|nr:lysylphosphatidylglycerol synthase transmembrane domain-containing protein [Methanoregula sp.]MDD5144119.1 lysylphosphatidylglycerol synthase transmembrane domain-containing protein [Methanoregula sp.]
MYRKISAIVIPTLFAAGIIGYMLYSVWDDLLVAFQHIVPAFLLIGIAICLMAWVLRGWRYRKILAGLNYSVKMTVSMACIFVSQTVNLVVPARLGDFVRVFILKHEYNTTYSEGVSSIVVERVFDIFTVALLGAISVFFVINAPSWFLTLIIVPLVAGIAFFGFLVVVGRFTSGNQYIAIILNMLHEIKRASLTLRSIVMLGSSSILIWLLDILVCYAVVMMFEQQIPFAVVVLAVVIGNLVKAVPLTPGGMGTYELSLALTFGLAGVSPAVATLIAVIDHLIKNIVTLAGGIISIYYLGDWVIPSIKEAVNTKFNGGKRPDGT